MFKGTEVMQDQLGFFRSYVYFSLVLFNLGFI